MTPRPYRPQERQRAVDEGRERIVTAARELLDLGHVSAFSLEAVAKRAGVTRMTVYNQFGSRAGLLEELFDGLMERGAFSRMPAVFMEKDLASAFDVFVEILGRFYTENRQVLARLSATAGLDPDLDEAMRTRNDRRRQAVDTLLKRLDKTVRPAVAAGELANTVDVLLSFNTFNALAGPSRTPEDVVKIVRQLLRGVIGESSPPNARKQVGKRARR